MKPEVTSGRPEPDWRNTLNSGWSGLPIETQRKAYKVVCTGTLYLAITLELAFLTDSWHPVLFLILPLFPDYCYVAWFDSLTPALTLGLTPTIRPSCLHLSPDTFSVLSTVISSAWPNHIGNTCFTETGFQITIQAQLFFFFFHLNTVALILCLPIYAVLMSIMGRDIFL